jgi:hydroxyacylglutathione hydrolase
VTTAERFVTTTTVVTGAGGSCLVIDPAVTVADLTALAAALAARGLRPVAGWSTHPHWDHILWHALLGADVPGTRHRRRWRSRSASAMASSNASRRPLPAMTWPCSAG